MSINSSFSNSSAPADDNVLQLLFCINSPSGAAITLAFTITCLLVLLPLYVFILSKGVQQWRKQQSSATMSHTEFLTYHMVIAELLSVIGTIFITISVYTQLPWLTHMGIVILSVNYIGQMLFQILACGERYLAVVHPITYLKLKNEKGTRIRNITIGCLWTLCIVCGATMLRQTQISFLFTTLVLTALALIFILIMNLIIFYVLVRLGPRGEGGRRQQCDPSKLRILFTTMVILGVLMLRFSWSIFSVVLLNANHMGEAERCSFVVSLMWINIPSNLVLPVLFLLKAQKRARLSQPK